jgi:hypothetical protein
MTAPKPGSASHRFETLRANRKRMDEMMKAVEASGDTSEKARELVHSLMAAMIHSRLGEMLMSTMLDAVKAGTVDEHGLPNDMPDHLKADLIAAGIDPRTPEFVADEEATQQAIGKAIQPQMKKRGLEDRLKQAIKDGLNGNAADIEVVTMKVGEDGWPVDMDPEQKAALVKMGAVPPSKEGFPPGLPPELVAKLRAMGMTGATMVRVPKEREQTFTGAAGTANPDGSDFEPTAEYKDFLARMEKLGAKAVSMTTVKLTEAQGEEMKAALADAGTDDVNALMQKAGGDDPECNCPACRVAGIVRRAIDAEQAQNPAGDDFADLPAGMKPH